MRFLTTAPSWLWDPNPEPLVPLEYVELDMRHWRLEHMSMTRHEIVFTDAQGQQVQGVVEIPDEQLARADDPMIFTCTALLQELRRMGVPEDIGRTYLETLSQRLQREQAVAEAIQRSGIAANELAWNMRRLGVTAREAGENMQRAFSMLPTAQEASSVLEAEHKHRYGSHIVIFEAPCPGCGNDVTWQQTMGYEGRPDTFQIWDEECCGGLP